MKYKILTTNSFDKSFRKLDRSVQIIISKWMIKNIMNTANPREHGKALTSNLKGYWRYRIGDYRVLAEIKDEELIIIAISIGHRKEIYK